MEKKYLVVGDFNSRLKFYLQAIKKTLQHKKSVIVLVPDLSLMKFFNFESLGCSVNEISGLHAGLTKTQRWLVFDKIRQGKIKIVIGSQSALFAPAKNLGLIIIDQEENETYKNDRSPRFHALKVAEKLSSLTAANLIAGSLVPRVETFYQALENNYILKKISSNDSISIPIVNMQGERQVLSQPLQEKIEETLAKKEGIILVLNRKGEGTKFSCPDCQWILTCQKCGMPLVPQKSDAVCYRCENISPLPNACPKCHNVQLKPFGLGTKKLEKFVRDFWPGARIVRIEELTPPPAGGWDIAIVTLFALKFRLPAIGLVGIIDADQGLNFPDFHSSEKNFQTFYKFLRIGREGIIQTRLPEHPAIGALSQMDYEKFFLSELNFRQKENYPPFVKLIKLVYKNPDEEKGQKESQKITQTLKSLQIPSIFIYGPSRPFFAKIRQNFRWQIIIKIKPQTPQKSLEKLYEILKNLPKGWIVDVEPTDLL